MGGSRVQERGGGEGGGGPPPGQWGGVRGPGRLWPSKNPAPPPRPPPVSFSPPKAPPISAPEGPIFTLAMPQSEPAAEMNVSASRMSRVKIEDERPAPTALCASIAASKS